jgi:hypothetical protein
MRKQARQSRILSNADRVRTGSVFRSHFLRRADQTIPSLVDETIDQAPVGILSSVARWVRQNFNYPPLLLLFTTGVFLRVILMVTYFPAVMLSFDSARYARIDSMPMFGDFWMPAGYPMLLRLLHAISHQLWFTIAVQHVMGLGVGLLLFAAARQLGVKRSMSCVPAAVPFLSGDHLYLEHQVMADYLLILLATTGLAAAVRGLVPRLNVRWLAMASASLAMAALARSVGIILIPILVLCALFGIRGPLNRRAAALGAALLPGAGVFGLYVGVFVSVHGQYLGLWDMSGWNLYSRVAPFADCRKFDPPDGTKILCEQSAPGERPGPFGYVWDLSSVPRVAFELGPKTGQKLAAFARQAILHQPGDYWRAIVSDLAKYVDPSVNPRPYSGQPPEILSFGWRDKTVEQAVVLAMSRGYRGTAVHLHGQRILALYQDMFRVGRLALCALLLLSVVGMLKAKGPIRLAICLFGLSACGLYVLPVLTISYDFRYGIPAETFLVVSGVLGAVSLWRRAVQPRIAS